MKDRIRQLMESQHMTQQVFAQFIEMSPASLSSIFNGRTKPTLNIVEAIKKKIPDISLDWLLSGSGAMYIDSSSASPTPSVGPDHVVESVLDFSDNVTPSSDTRSSSFNFSVAPNNNPNSVKPTRTNIVREEVKTIDKAPRRVTEIRVFYDDQTWESFVPAKK